MNLDGGVDGLNVLDRREQVGWRVINVEAREAIVCG